jgi:hypothetical protein
MGFLTSANGTRNQSSLRRPQAAAAASRHVCIADALKTRCVLAEVRWRWTLKALWAAACTEKSLRRSHA